MRARSLLAIAIVLLGSAPAARAQDSWPTHGWATTRPAAVGLDSARLAAFDADIAAGKYGYVDGLLVIRHGRIAYERGYRHDYAAIYGPEVGKPGPLNAHDPGGPYNYFNDWWHPFYRRGELHSLQSVTKTVTSIVYGAAVARGDFPSIDTPILTFFDTTEVANLDARKRRITVRHLLTMTAGLDWNEGLPYTDPRNTAVQLEASADWVRFTIDRPMEAEPGRTFDYNSGASALLAHIFRVATGRDIEEYAAAHVFAPLGITSWFWKRGPTGLADTEGGLYLRPRDLAKLWLLFLRNGSWDGQRIVTPEWVKASVTPAVPVGDSGLKYGLKWWLLPYGADGRELAWAGSGFGGQVPIAFPDEDMLVVVTAWNILPGKPGLPRKVIMDRLLESVTGR